MAMSCCDCACTGVNKDSLITTVLYSFEKINDTKLQRGKNSRVSIHEKPPQLLQQLEACKCHPHSHAPQLQHRHGHYRRATNPSTARLGRYDTSIILPALLT